MPAFSFYGVGRDWDAVLNTVFAKGALALIPDKNYRQGRAARFSKRTTTFDQGFSRKRMAFIVGAFTKERIKLCRGGRSFVVSELESGPMLRLLLPGAEDDGSIVWLRPGSISYRDRFWTAGFKTQYPPPESLRETFVELVARLKRLLHKRRFGIWVWLGQDALNLLSNGRARILVRGRWWTFEESVARPTDLRE